MLRNKLDDRLLVSLLKILQYYLMLPVVPVASHLLESLHPSKWMMFQVVIEWIIFIFLEVML